MIQDGLQLRSGLPCQKVTGIAIASVTVTGYRRQPGRSEVPQPTLLTGIRKIDTGESARRVVGPAAGSFTASLPPDTARSCIRLGLPLVGSPGSGHKVQPQRYRARRLDRIPSTLDSVQMLGPLMHPQLPFVGWGLPSYIALVMSLHARLGAGPDTGD